MREAAFFISRQSHSTSAGALHGLVGTFKSLYRAYTQRRQVVQLSDVDDHLLTDIGLTREDVRSALDMPFSCDPSLELQRRAVRNRRKGWRG